ncbi:hypothetical protein FACS1894181_15500 [Bacteroidia bacterium]|nr:hypothetical protein FACS1894181_15500 [Bacteroidia bacterium]
MKKGFIFLLCLTGAAAFAQVVETEQTALERLERRTDLVESAVVKLQKLKVSGFVQAQYQRGGKDAALKVGAPNENPEKPFNRVGVRLAHLKLVYEEGLASATFQTNFTERGIFLKDAFLAVKDPWISTVVLKGGIFFRPFGHEISYSALLRESPERATVIQTLFPEERDLGFSLTLQPAKTSAWNFLKLEAGWFAGNGIQREIDSRLDFIGHLFFEKNIEKTITIGGGVSYYNGGVYQGTPNVYSVHENSFAIDSAPGNKGAFAKREYAGMDAQFSLSSPAGMTQLRAEYLAGSQPSSNPSSSKSPNASTLPTTDTYIRKFTGGYVIFVQDFGKLPFSAVLKYDWYNPNTQVGGNNITMAGDISQHTSGFGLLYRINPNLRLQAYYELNQNETTNKLEAYSTDRQDDTFTLRLQCKF